MKHFHLFIIAVLGLLAIPALASSTNASAGANSGAAAGAISGTSSSQSITFTSPPETSIKYSGTQTIKEAPPVYVNSAQATSPCRIALSAGVSVIALGVGAAGSIEDEKCTSREEERMNDDHAKTLFMMGEKTMAISVMCGIKAVAAANPDRCGAQPAKVSASIAPTTTVSNKDVNVVATPLNQEVATLETDGSFATKK